MSEVFLMSPPPLLNLCTKSISQEWKEKKKNCDIYIYHNWILKYWLCFLQLKNDEEDWLQEAMASLVYLSQSSPEDM